MMTATTEIATGTSPEAAAAGENGVRAALYGVLAHLFADRPGAELLERIAEAELMIVAEDSLLAREWQALCQAAAAADPAAVADEFDALFVSTSLPLVSLYASSYMSGRQRGHLLAELRGDLARIGYMRADDSSEYEDHFSALCDVMRGLIGEAAMSTDAVEQHQVFFQHYLAPWHGRLFEKIDQATGADFYRKVARVADAFLTHESQYFELA
jgi:TorA maturation chaperone TorD